MIKSPKYSLASMLLLVTVAALSSYIIFDQQKRTVAVDGGYFEFEIPENSINKSRWNDRLSSPKLDLVAAAAVGSRVCTHLDSGKEAIGYDKWQINSIALHNLEDELGEEENTWAYIIRLSPAERHPSRPGVEQVLYVHIAITLDGKEFYDSEIENEYISAALAAIGLMDLSK